MKVLVGHTDAVLTVAVSVTNKSQVISGSKDCNLIVWDLHTGEEIHTLAGHLGAVTCVKISADGKTAVISTDNDVHECVRAFLLLSPKGTTAVSGSDDKTIIVWETLRGLALTSLQLHVQFTRFDISLECSRILVHLTDNPSFPIICLHNSPAQYIKLPTYSAPARDVEGKRINVQVSVVIIVNKHSRFTSSSRETSSAAAAEEGIIPRHVLMAEKIRSSDLVGDDGAGRRAT